MTIWTVGHSTRTIGEFMKVLASHRIRVVADVRQFPGSRRFPQFNKVQLERSLATDSIGYVHFPELGGRRKPKPDSRNTAWRNEGFRGYADYMETSEFRHGLERLLRIARGNTAIMCAEALWWRCHRALISDYLKTKNIDVVHIIDDNKTSPHPYTPAARLLGGELSYRSDDQLL